MPVLIMLVLVPVQVGLWWHGKQAAEVAAEEALDAAQVAGAGVAEGLSGAEAILSQAGNLVDVSVTIDRNVEHVTVTVQAELGFSIFPGSWSVTAEAHGPVERFIAEIDR